MTPRIRTALSRHNAGPVLGRGVRGCAAALTLVFLVFSGCAEDEPATTTPTDPAPAAEQTPQQTRDPNPVGNTGMAARYPIDPCELLTAEDVGDALGQPVGDGERDNRICTWTSSEDDAVSVLLTAHGEGQKPRAVCSDLEESGEPVEGLAHPMAQEASYSDAEGLSVFTGENLPAHSCLIFVSSPREALGLDDLKALAEIALENHPFKEDD